MLFSGINKKFTVFQAIAILATALVTFLLTPTYISLISDIVTQGSLITAIVYYASSILSELVFALLICLIACGEYVLSQDETARAVNRTAVFSISVLSYVFNFLSTAFKNGFSSLDEDDIFSSLLNAVVDAAILFVVMMISKRMTQRHLEESRVLNKAYQLTEGHSYDERSTVFPYERFIKVKAMIIGPIFWGTLITFILNVLSTVYYDLLCGLPTDIDEIIEMVKMYLGLTIMFAVSYTFAYFMSYLFLSKDKE